MVSLRRDLVAVTGTISHIAERVNKRCVLRFASVCGVRQVVAWKGGRLDAQSRSDQGSESDRTLERASRFFAYAKNAPSLSLGNFRTYALLTSLQQKLVLLNIPVKCLSCRSWQLLVRLEKMGLNKQEILVLAETNRDNYSVHIKSDTPGFWQISIHIGNPERSFDVFTSRGDLKTWRNLADAVLFIRETCKDCMNVQISIQDWTFGRRS
jgi:hypothetical protein